MPKALARVATSWPIRPKPSTPSVLPSTSVPPNLLRSHLPPVRLAWACGMLRAQREHQRDGVLGRRDRVRLGGVGDDDALLRGGGDVDVVHADARAADDAEVVGLLDQLRVALRGGADQDAVVARRSGPAGRRGSSPCRRRRRTARAACPRRIRRSSPRRGRGAARSGSCRRRDAGVHEHLLRRADARRRARRRGRAGRAPSRRR